MKKHDSRFDKFVSGEGGINAMQAVSASLNDGTTKVDDIFETEVPDDVMEMMSDLVELIAIEDDELKKLERTLNARKEKLDGTRLQMHELLIANNCANGHKFDNGILIKPKIKTTVFRGKEVSDDVLFAWLRENNLDSIIKLAVHYQTLSSTMKEEIERGRELPDIFNIVDKKTINFAGNGKAEFLAAREGIS